MAARRLPRVADGLRNAQARSDAHVGTSVAHGVGLESRYMSQVCGTDVRSAAGAAGPVLTHAGKELPVHDASAATVLAAAACAPVRLLGARTGSVAGTMSRLNEALSSSGYDLKIQVPSLRAGWLEWSTAVGAEAVESREEES